MLDRRVEMPALRADGTEFPVELTITRVVGSQPPLFTGCLRDITERKRSEAERAELLTREQAARTQAEALAEDLRQQQKAKDEFLAILGHELRNPLAPVSNALRVLLDRGTADTVARGLHELMDRQVRHMTRLVDDLLDVSRIGRGAIGMRRESVDLVEVIAHVVEANRPFVDERRHRLTRSMPEGPLRVVGDPTRLEQIVSNLLNNAVRYTPAGGEIALALERAGDEAIVRVRDSGIGIKPELLPRVFEAFVQADRVAGSVHEGLGLGLTLVKKIAELHGGSVAAASAGPGLGSEFVVRFPLDRAGAEPTAPAPERTDAARGILRPVPRQQRRILVVDDNRDSAETLAMMLSFHGHETTVAQDGHDALAKFRARRPDFVFLDIELPNGMSGHEVALCMAREPGAEGVRLVAVTGYGQPEDRERSRAAGFHSHLVKPVEIEELLRVMDVLESGAVGDGASEEH
jgi:two-component system CheB/CheR fusion protein